MESERCRLSDLRSGLTRPLNVALATSGIAQDDLARELPRIKPLEPAAALDVVPDS